MEVVNDGAPPAFVAKLEGLVYKSGLRARYGRIWLKMDDVDPGLVSALIDGEKERVAAATPEELFALVVQALYRADEHKGQP